MLNLPENVLRNMESRSDSVAISGDMGPPRSGGGIAFLQKTTQISDFKQQTADLVAIQSPDSLLEDKV